MGEEAGFVLVDGGVGFFLCEALLVVDDEFALVAVEGAEEEGGGVGKGYEVWEGCGEA